MVILYGQRLVTEFRQLLEKTLWQRQFAQFRFDGKLLECPGTHQNPIFIRPDRLSRCGSKFFGRVYCPQQGAGVHQHRGDHSFNPKARASSSFHESKPGALRIWPRIAPKRCLPDLGRYGTNCTIGFPALPITTGLPVRTTESTKDDRRVLLSVIVSVFTG